MGNNPSFLHVKPLPAAPTVEAGQFPTLTWPPQAESSFPKALKAFLERQAPASQSTPFQEEAKTLGF